LITKPFLVDFILNKKNSKTNKKNFLNYRNVSTTNSELANVTLFKPLLS
jgi:hypothetical protein